MTDPGWRYPVLVYGVVLAVLLLVSWQTIDRVVENPHGLPGFAFAGDGFWGGWVRFDGGWYTKIAAEGYSYLPGAQSTVAFFPAYPLAIRAVDAVVSSATARFRLPEIRSAVLFRDRWVVVAGRGAPVGDRLTLGDHLPHQALDGTGWPL